MTNEFKITGLLNCKFQLKTFGVCPLCTGERKKETPSLLHQKHVNRKNEHFGCKDILVYNIKQGKLPNLTAVQDFLIYKRTLKTL